MDVTLVKHASDHSTYHSPHQSENETSLSHQQNFTTRNHASTKITESQRASTLHLSLLEDNDAESDSSSSDDSTATVQNKVPIETDLGIDVEVERVNEMQSTQELRPMAHQNTQVFKTFLSSHNSKGTPKLRNHRQPFQRATPLEANNTGSGGFNLHLHQDHPKNRKSLRRKERERISRSVESTGHTIVKRSKRSRNTEIKLRFAQPPVECERRSPVRYERCAEALKPCYSNWDQCYQPTEEPCTSEISKPSSRRSSGSERRKVHTAVYCPEPHRSPCSSDRPLILIPNCIQDQQEKRQQGCIQLIQQPPPPPAIHVKESTLNLKVMNRHHRITSLHKPTTRAKTMGQLRGNAANSFDDGNEGDYDDDDDLKISPRQMRRNTYGQQLERRESNETPHERNAEHPNTLIGSTEQQSKIPGPSPALQSPKWGSQSRRPTPILASPPPRHEILAEQRFQFPNTTDNSIRVSGYDYPFAGISPSGNLKVNPREIAFENDRAAVLVHDAQFNVRQHRTYDNEQQQHHYDQKPYIQQPPPVPPFPEEYILRRQDNYERMHPTSYTSELLAENSKGSQEFLEVVHHCIKKAIDADTIILLGNQEFRCHHVALQAYSSFFKKEQRSRDKMMEIRLPEDIVQPEFFPNLIDWIIIEDQKKKLVINRDNVVGLFSAASYLGIPPLKRDCINFIKIKVEVEDPIILKMYEEASRNPQCAELLSLLSTKLAKLFPKLHDTAQFLHMNVTELCILLDSESLNIKSEMEVCDAAVRWLVYEWSTRSRYTVQVMSTVRFGLLSPVELTQIQFNTKQDQLPNYEKIFAQPEVKAMVENGLKYAIWREKYKTKPGELNKWLVASGIPEPRPRHKLTNALGDPNRTYYEEYEREDESKIVDEQLNENMKDLTIREDSMSTFAKRKGSGDHQKGQRGQKNSGQYVELTKQRERIHSAITIQAAVRAWIMRRKFQKMKTAATTIQAAFRMFRRNVEAKKKARRGPKFSVLKFPVLEGLRIKNMRLHECDSLIVLGGHDPTQDLGDYNTGSEIYQFHSVNKIWSRMGQLPEPRIHGGAVLYSGYIIFFGGADPRYKSSRDKSIPCATTWSLHVHGGNWKKLADMTTPRSYFGYVLSHGKIWVFGGVDVEGKALSTCERYNPEKNTWTQISSMDGPRLGMSVTKFADKVWIAGGLTKNPKSPILRSVISYDITKDSFSPLPALPYPKAHGTMAAFYTKVFFFAGAGKIGTRNTHSTNDVIVFDKGHWESIARLSIPRHGHCQLKLGKYMMLIGGVNSESQEPVETCEVFNMMKYTVSTRIPPLPKKLVGCCGVVISP